MTRARIIVEPHESLPGSEESQPNPNAASRWKLSNKEPRKPSLHWVRHVEVKGAGYHRERRHETVAVPIFEAVLHPVAPAGDATARLAQEFGVTEWCLMRIVKRHFALRTGGLTSLRGFHAAIKSRSGDESAYSPAAEPHSDSVDYPHREEGGRRDHKRTPPIGAAKTIEVSHAE
jgi:hypothetical protein